MRSTRSSSRALLCLQGPLLAIALHTCHGNFTWVNLGLFALGTPLFFASFALERYFKRPPPSK
jgi:hypothetical protein